MLFMKIDEITKENLSKRIAGEIVLSDTPGKTIQKWRNIFKIPQRRLADKMEMIYTQIGPDNSSTSEKTVFQSENTANIKIKLKPEAVKQSEYIII